MRTSITIGNVEFYNDDRSANYSINEWDCCSAGKYIGKVILESLTMQYLFIPSFFGAYSKSILDDISNFIGIQQKIK